MPKLNTTLHTDMFKGWKHHRRFPFRIVGALKVLMSKNDVYGLQWGDPETLPPMRYVRDHFLLPYIRPDGVVAEIGPGGGRWTRYMLGAKRIYAVEYHQTLLNELKSTVRAQNIVYIKNNGDDFPGIEDGTVDFVFSFGTFVHLDLDIINRYLENMKRVLKDRANAVIHYSDKTKPLGKTDSGFSDNDPEEMRRAVLSHGYRIFEEDTKTLWHSSIIRFGLRGDENPQASNG